jgi:hypothetical protein
MTEQRFHCPARGCYAVYDVGFRSYQPSQTPKCEQCGWGFPVKYETRWLHYKSAGDGPRSDDGNNAER